VVWYLTPENTSHWRTIVLKFCPSLLAPTLNLREFTTFCFGCLSQCVLLIAAHQLQFFLMKA
jgi:hypothetical protein